MTDEDRVPTAEEAEAAVLKALYRAVNDGGKMRHIRFVCEHHHAFDPNKSPAGLVAQGTNSGGNVYHEVEAYLIDAATINACKELMDRMKGKAITPKAPPEPPKVTGRLEDLTDDELEQLLNSE